MKLEPESPILEKENWNVSENGNQVHVLVYIHSHETLFLAKCIRYTIAVYCAEEPPNKGYFVGNINSAALVLCREFGLFWRIKMYWNYREEFLRHTGLHTGFGARGGKLSFLKS